MRTSLALLLVGLLAVDDRESWTTVSAADPSALSARVPANIIFDDVLQNVVVEMLLGSHTFRQQCSRLGTVRELAVRVSVDLETRWSGRRESNARGMITRYRYGRIEADIRLLTVANVQSLIAHELEHVREYVEGINYLVTSVQYPARVWLTRQGHYESTRAIETGERVGEEMARHRSRRSTATLARK